MKHDMERVFKEALEAIKASGLESEEEIQELLEEYAEEYNARLDAGREYDSYDYLEMAEDAECNADSVYYAKEALKLDPYCLDAELIITRAKSYNPERMQKNLEKLIKKADKQLIEQNISKEKDAGNFYGIFETRPYMRLRNEYLGALIELGKFRLAASEAEEILRLNENDNLGARYTLMALYAYFEDEDKAEALYDKYPEESAFMLLPLIALYYKADNNKKMKSAIRKLKKANPDALEALELLIDEDEEEVVEEVMSKEAYRPFSAEEVIMAFMQSQFLYFTMPVFLHILRNETEKIK